MQRCELAHCQLYLSLAVFTVSTNAAGPVASSYHSSNTVSYSCASFSITEDFKNTPKAHFVQHSAGAVIAAHARSNLCKTLYAMQPQRSTTGFCMLLVARSHSRAAVVKLAPIAVIPDSTRTLVRCTTDSERCSSCRSVTAFLSVDSMSPLQTDV
eukprot:18965-Heterococcus_DN1.PRE.3